MCCDSLEYLVVFFIICLHTSYSISIGFTTMISLPGWYRVHGLVQSSGACIWCGATGEDYWRLPGPVPVVRGRQKASLPTLDQTCWHRTTTTAGLQMVPRSDSAQVFVVRRINSRMLSWRWLSTLCNTSVAFWWNFLWIIWKHYDDSPQVSTTCRMFGRRQRESATWCWSLALRRCMRRLIWPCSTGCCVLLLTTTLLITWQPRTMWSSTTRLPTFILRSCLIGISFINNYLKLYCADGCDNLLF